MQIINGDSNIPPLYAPTVLTTSPFPMMLPQEPSNPFSLTPDGAEVDMFQYSSVGDTVLVPAGMGVWVPV